MQDLIQIPVFPVYSGFIHYFYSDSPFLLTHVLIQFLISQYSNEY